jgi:hypothetical protein
MIYPGCKIRIDIMPDRACLESYEFHHYYRNARLHNLINITLEIPEDQLVVITGLSSSGKSTLAFDVLYKEGTRRYMESLSHNLFSIFLCLEA